VFGTPWAGAVFAIEVMRHWHWPRKAVLPVLAAAWLAHLSCVALGASHAAYPLPALPGLHLQWLGYSALAGLAFGLAAWLFIALSHLQSSLYERLLPDARWRGLLGGTVLLAVLLLFEPHRYLGLGLPIIEAAFSTPQLPYDFALKILFTSFTLAVGFKGGEVTPLFFIGATLGNALVWWLPLPMPLLAGMGFVAVFASATNTPLACVVMGIELFGWSAAPYLSVACGLAYLFSGKKSIYR
jgi:H+/Cl- antiporter ClcA